MVEMKFTPRITGEKKKKQLSYVDYESVLRFDIYIYAILTSSYFFFMN